MIPPNVPKAARAGVAAPRAGVLVCVEKTDPHSGRLSNGAHNCAQGHRRCRIVLTERIMRPATGKNDAPMRRYKTAPRRAGPQWLAASPQLAPANRQTDTATMQRVVLLCLVAAAAARPQDFNQPAPKTLEEAGILRMDMNMNEDGSFQYGYETTDPIQADVTGEQRTIGAESGTVMQGSYSFTTPEGQQVTINWIADENGFQPTGDAIPVDANSAAGQPF